MAKSGKIGRNKDWCKNYRANQTADKNAIRKIIKHLMGHENDKASWARLKKFGLLLVTNSLYRLTAKAKKFAEANQARWA